MNSLQRTAGLRPAQRPLRLGPALCGAALGLLLALAAGCPRAGRGAGTPHAGAGAARPPLEARLRDLQGREVALSHFRGKPLVVVFFTTWCVPCQVVVTRLQRVRAALGNTRVGVLGVALDTERRLVPTFVEAAGFNFPVVYGSPDFVRGGPFGPIRGVPRLLVLDPSGRLVADEATPPSMQRLLDLLRPWVRRSPAPRK